MFMTQLTAAHYRFGWFTMIIQRRCSSVSDYLRRQPKLARIRLRIQTTGIISRLRSKVARPGDRARLCMLCVIALYGTVSLTTSVARAQQLSAGDFAPEAATTASGWWSPQRTAFTVLAPQSQLSVSKLIKISEPRYFSTPQRGKGHPANDINRLTVNVSGFDFQFVRRSPELTSLAEVELLSSPLLLSRLNAEYATWESSLADSRSLTIVNGSPVYPLLQVSHAYLDFSISLYVPPLRGSGVRW
jgi:hypothetical protein